MRRALLALAAIAILGAGVAGFTTPVPVLSVSGGKNGFIGSLRDGEQFVYSYRQSVYNATVWEEFIRDDDQLQLLRVRAEDIRAVEYFRWDSPIRQESTYFVADAPPTEREELVIRIAPGAQQRFRSGGWSLFLEERFGETVVSVKLERPPMLLALARGLVW